MIVARDDVDAVMAAIVGAAGLPATLAAARAGKQVLLANKEALVMSGALFMKAVAEGGATLLPIDSEHSAIFQSLPRGFACGREGELERAGARRVLLTASGGPFRTTPVDRLARVTPRAGVRASELGDGPQDLGGLGHHDEQGPRGDRGPLALRRCRWSRSRSSCIRRA